MIPKYCPQCGTKLIYKEVKHEGQIPYCPSCCDLVFPHGDPCVISFIIYQGKALLIKQNYVSNQYVLVAGHIKYNETAEHTLIQEIKEEVGLKVVSYQYIGSYFYPKRGNIMFGYLAYCDGKITLNEEVDSYLLVEIEQVLEYLKDPSIGYQLFQGIQKGNFL